jgi:hypothetical protein
MMSSDIKFVLDSNMLKTKIPLNFSSNPIIINREFLKKYNQNFLLSPMAFDLISITYHCELFIDPNKNIFIRDVERKARVYVNGILVSDGYMRIQEGSIIQLPIQALKDL